MELKSTSQKSCRGKPTNPAGTRWIWQRLTITLSVGGSITPQQSITARNPAKNILHGAENDIWYKHMLFNEVLYPNHMSCSLYRIYSAVEKYIIIININMG